MIFYLLPFHWKGCKMFNKGSVSVRPSTACIKPESPYSATIIYYQKRFEQSSFSPSPVSLTYLARDGNDAADTLAAMFLRVRKATQQ